MLWVCECAVQTIVPRVGCKPVAEEPEEADEAEEEEHEEAEPVPGKRQRLDVDDWRYNVAKDKGEGKGKADVPGDGTGKAKNSSWGHRGYRWAQRRHNDNRRAHRGPKIYQFPVAADPLCQGQAVLRRHGRETEDHTHLKF